MWWGWTTVRCLLHRGVRRMSWSLSISWSTIRWALHYLILDRRSHGMEMTVRRSNGTYCMWWHSQSRCGAHRCWIAICEVIWVRLSVAHDWRVRHCSRWWTHIQVSWIDPEIRPVVTVVRLGLWTRHWRSPRHRWTLWWSLSNCVTQRRRWRAVAWTFESRRIHELRPVIEHWWLLMSRSTMRRVSGFVSLTLQTRS